MSKYLIEWRICSGEGVLTVWEVLNSEEVYLFSQKETEKAGF